MRNRCFRVLAVTLSISVTGCTALDFDQLVPVTASDFSSDAGPIVVNICPNSFTDHGDSIARAKSNADQIASTLPAALQSDAVVNALISQFKYTVSKSITNMHAATGTAMSYANSQASAQISKPQTSLTLQDFQKFANLISEHVLRHTVANSASSTIDGGTIFWAKLKAYYIAYFNGDFYDYFGTKFGAPTTSLTVSDSEIITATRIFTELLMDEILESPLWVTGSGGKKTYYPGGNTNKPTFLSVNDMLVQAYHIPAINQNSPFSTGWKGCGMNVAKAKTVKFLAQAFATAAATDTGLAIKSIGGIEIGLGILGKFSIGDNSTLTGIVNAAISEVVGRLTVQVTTPILEAYDFEQASQQTAVVDTALLKLKSGKKLMEDAELVRVMSSPFVSAKSTAF